MSELNEMNALSAERHLASYGMRSQNSRGRRYKEPEHPYRSVYQRDRERILHTTAFRRLEYKTQVFVNHEGDYYRTRLTHTLEVAQIARTIARALFLNEDLVESIALAHDLGHTPFGHAGEEILQEIMKSHGGFDHNLQGLRVVDILEERYPDFQGLNLSWEVREGIVRHSTSYDRPPVVSEFSSDEMPSLETQVVDVADEVAYDSHDLDDGLVSGILSEEELSNVEIWQDISLLVQNMYKTMTQQQRRYQIVRMLINTYVTDLINQTKASLKSQDIRSFEDVRKMDKRLVSFSGDMDKTRLVLRKHLADNFYKNYRVVRMAGKAKRFIKELFEVYLDIPKALPSPYKGLATKEADRYRVICDYIAGMTDRYALNEYKKFFDPYERV